MKNNSTVAASIQSTFGEIAPNEHGMTLAPAGTSEYTSNTNKGATMKKINQATRSTHAANDQFFDPSDPFSPIVAIFPVMSPDDFIELKQDIKENGLLVPIQVQSGKIIDGRHRYWACAELGIPAQYIEVDPKDSGIAHAIGCNMKRRQLNEFHKIEIANNIGQLPVGSNQHTATAAPSQGALAKILKTSADTLQRGKKIFRNGSEMLKSAVRSGELSVSDGALMTELPKEKQDELLNNGVQNAKRVIKALNLDKKQKFREEKVRLTLEMEKNSPTFKGIKQHSVIYADPPWDYLGIDGTEYPTMKLGDICAMEVEKVSTEHSVLLMWATASRLEEALQVIKAWGFKYVTCAVWDKKTAGQGAYFRQQHELLLVGTKGQPPCVDPMATSPSVISELRGDHSVKPDSCYEMIEKMYPELSKLELFSRSERKGWTMWGNQAGQRKSA